MSRPRLDPLHRMLSAQPGPRLRDFRPDVEGLRAVAVLVVVAYHAGIPGLGGGFIGVDVFLVISGFLITRMLTRELQATGRIDLRRFYARRARRLLPAAVLVTVVTAVAGWLVLSPLAARDLVRDAAFTAAYGMNWNLAEQGTDYLHATEAPSALQHYWSLSVEEQYYLLWPALLLGTWALASRRRRHERDVVDVREATLAWAAGRPRLAVAGLLSAIVVVSFTAGVVQTRDSAPWAYFGLHTRAWELALGALIALAAPALSRRPARTAGLVGWAGLLAVGLAAIAFDASTPFPGYAALLPTLGAAAVIAAGCSAPRGGAEAVLGRSPLQVIGALSYGWYLWHWPLLRLVPQALGHPLSTRANAAVCGIALVLAALGFAIVEHPVRSAARLHAMTNAVLVSAVTATAAVAAAAVLALAVAPPVTGRGDDRQLADLVAVAPTESGRPRTADLAPSASLQQQMDRALQAGLQPTAVPANLDPRLDRALTTLPRAQSDGCHAGFDVSRVAPGVGTTDCVYGDRSGTQTLVLFGDSHALQWFPALDELAKARHWRLVSLTKSSCTPFRVTVWNETFKRAYTECDTWRDDALALLERLRPHHVVVSAMTGVLDHGLSGGGEGFDRAWADGVTNTLGRLTTITTDVTVIDDTPSPGEDVPDCVADNLSDQSACSFGRAAGLYPEARRSAQHAAAVATGARVLDPTAWLCADRCPVVVGNVLVYRDSHHISTPLALWLKPALDQALARTPAEEQ